MSNSAAIATPVKDVQGDRRWMSMHERFLREGKDSACQVLFVGDSLIFHMHDTQEWEEYFKPLRVLNFGIGGDRTENTLWRLQNGELSSIEPKVVVLLVGTNNHGCTAEQIVEGIECIVWTIHELVPDAKVLVLGLLPRGEKPNPIRERHFEVNHALKDIIPAIPGATFLDADPGFVRSDGMIDHTDMADYLHLTRKGYKRFMKRIHEVVLKLLKY
ncbi:predicted protein [Nematostella vectensis]|uniref:SGNH hydrolase-type esterase domain-containing protein n=1 Tax=Nematostella vectensis TaxID=45351 RepID=A7RR23_NEMVE|nr:platelet-activating factor acetylhydrolase IB subunit alpha1 [Nematostella vectensis]EDO46036.1 predicted protein [Nematostella vectensis]|eukprot:XP_001638099.1 predicted protein [Nematostella vectensis]